MAPTVVDLVKVPDVSGEAAIAESWPSESDGPPTTSESGSTSRHRRREREWVALTHGPKRLDEGLIVALAEKNLLPIIATG
jgi:hypothetical protein